MSHPSTVNKFSQIAVFLFIWVAASIAGIYFRLYPLTHYATGENTEKATLIVISSLRKTALKEVEQKYPQSSIVGKRQLAQERFNQILKNDSPKIRHLINNIAGEMDSKLNLKGTPYLLEADPYYFYQLTENITKTGQLGTAIKGSKYFNPLMIAPTGTWAPFTLHPYVGYVVYKAIQIFNPQVSLMYALSFTPILLFVLSLIPFILICQRILNCSPWAILAGAFSFALASAYLKRSMFGWYDNDPYNTLLPLLILLVFFQSLVFEVSRRKALLLGLVTCLLITLYALFWQGWVFMESIVVLSALLIIPYNYFWLKSHIRTRNIIIYFSGILAGTLLGISIAFGPKEFFILFQEAWKALTEFTTRHLTIWPDMYLAVGELRGTTLKELVDLTDSPVIFVVALSGFLSILITTFRRSNTDKTIGYRYLPLAFYFIFALVMTLKAQRFAFLYLVPAGLLFVIGWNSLLEWIDKNLQKYWPQDQHHFFRFQIICGCLTAAIILLCVKNASLKTESLVTSIYNDTWNQAMIAIRDKTPENSIINSWWPPGHFIKAIAHRSVTFDGATINQPQAYWMAQVFLNANEHRALGVLRMLNNSANQAPEYLQSTGMPLSKAVNLLLSLALLNEEQARLKLKSQLTPEQIDTVLTLTHRVPPPSYLLVYNDLIEKNILINFTGKWNFQKIEEFNNNPRLLQQLPAPGSREFMQFLWSLAGKQPRYSDKLGVVARTGSTILFEHRVAIDLDTKMCTINSPVFGKGVPTSLFFINNDGEFVEKKFVNANLSYSAVLVQRGSEFTCILMETDTAKSILMRLFFFDGKGLKYIEPFFSTVDLTRRTEIYIYRVNWEKFLQDIDSKNRP